MRDQPLSGGVGGLLAPGSPFRIFLTPWLMILMGEKDRVFVALGWEAVAGRRCLKIEITNASGGIRDRFWLDIERNAIPIKYENYSGSQLRGRSIEIELARFDSGEGKTIWLPVRGKDQSFLKGLSYSSHPTVEETYQVVGGTVRLNQELPDSRFSLDWTAKASTPSLAAVTKDFAKAKVQRDDPAAVQRDLDRKVSEAKRQSKLLEASSPWREPWLVRNFWVIALPLLGILLLGVTTYLKFRGWDNNL